MGTSFKKEIFEEHVQVGLIGWAEKVKKRKGLGSPLRPKAAGVQLQAVGNSRAQTLGDGNVEPAEVRSSE